MSEKKDSHPHDTGYRLLLSYWEIVQQLVEGYVDEDWAKKLDFENSERMDGTFILKDFQKKETDVLYKVKMLGEDGQSSEEEIYLYLLIEHQSSVDYTLPFRILVYLTRIWTHIFDNTDQKEREKKSFRFPPVFPLVLYNGEREWTAASSMADIVSHGETLIASS